MTVYITSAPERSHRRGDDPFVEFEDPGSGLRHHPSDETLESVGGLEQLSAAHEAVSAYHGNNYLPLLKGFYRSHRPALFTLVDTLDMVSATADRSVLDAVELIRANRDHRSEWIEEKTTRTRDGQQVAVAVDVDAFAWVMWRKVLRDKHRPGRQSASAIGRQGSGHPRAHRRGT